MEKKRITLEMKQMMIALLVSLLLVLPVALSGTMIEVQAASESATNKKAHVLYNKKVNNLRKLGTYVAYKYVDISGDGIHEALIEYHPNTGGSGRIFQIYTYKNGKMVRILNSREYGLSKVMVYAKSKSLVYYRAGHGGEGYCYYKLKNGKYQLVASRGRVAYAGGGSYNGSWYYYNSKDKAITKTKFASLTKGMTTGSKKTMKIQNWKMLF